MVFFAKDQAVVAIHPENEQPISTAAKHPSGKKKTPPAAKHLQQQRPSHSKRQSICHRGGQRQDGKTSINEESDSGKPSATSDAGEVR
jgi:hypothetical protein